MSATIMKVLSQVRYTTTGKHTSQDAMKSTKRTVIFLTTLLYLPITQSFPHLPIQ